MRRSSFTLLLATLGTTAPVFAQHANVWYFGHKAGLDFNSGTPVPLLDGQMIAFEGCATMCDDNGDLLFYTNGGPVFPPPYDVGAVWTNTHAVMPNGDLNAGGGCQSASQGSLIVQDPGNVDHYYVFTLDCIENQFVGGLRYFEVDMNLNGGLGDVSAASVPLLADANESMLGIRHANGTDVWILVHGEPPSNLYYSFLVTAAGISAQDTVSIGPAISGGGGQLATNLSGTKVHYSGITHSALFNFDPATGVLSNHVDLLHNGIVGCAFAPGGQYLYTSEQQNLRRVFQYDLLAPDVQASEVVIGAGISFQAGMQLGPDGKIYMARGHHEYLGVINNPDSAGTAADYQEEGLYLGGRESRYALPNFVNDLLQPYALGIGEGTTAPAVECIVIGDELRIIGSAERGQGTFTIVRSDGALMHQGPITGSTTTVPIAHFAAGMYVVRLADAADRIRVGRFVIGG